MNGLKRGTKTLSRYFRGINGLKQGTDELKQGTDEVIVSRYRHGTSKY